MKRDGRTVYLNFAAVAGVVAAQYFHERGFARAVFAHQGQHFARAKRQIDAVQHFHTSETACECRASPAAARPIRFGPCGYLGFPPG